MKKVFSSLVHFASVMIHLSKGSTPAPDAATTLKSLSPTAADFLSSPEAQQVITDLEQLIEDKILSKAETPEALAKLKADIAADFESYIETRFTKFSSEAIASIEAAIIAKLVPSPTQTA